MRTDIIIRGLKFSVIVGTILVCINHLDCCIFESQIAEHLSKILLTYCVSYLVSSFSSAQAIIQNAGQDEVKQTLAKCQYAKNKHHYFQKKFNVFSPLSFLYIGQRNSPLIDNSKPVARQGRKTKGLSKIAQSPKEFKMNRKHIPFEF